MLPKEFLLRMEALLGPSYPAFLGSLSEEQNVHGVRYNADKIEKETLLSYLGEHLTPIPYTEDGFISSIEKIGRHPFHHAGAVYAQDPGAMAPLSSLTIERGWRVADLCAAPGGKSAQLATAVGNDGFLLSNEITTSRAKILVGNLERMGVRNTVVTSVDAKTLAEWFSAYFDLVLVDAPCSGEGMFRKYDYAQSEWTPALVPMCAERQAGILAHAATMVKDGGYLLYSTCTFSVEENEENIDAFLSVHPEFSVCTVREALAVVTENGVAYDGAVHKDALGLSRRFYPHRYPGEGQFMCLLQKNGAEQTPRICFKDTFSSLSREEARLADEFLADVLDQPLEKILPNFIIKKHKDMLCLIHKDIPLVPHSIYLCGVAIGTVKKGRIEVHHQFFSAMGKFFKRKLDFSPDDARLAAYLHGDTLSCDLPNGYAAVTVCGAPVGGVKCSGGVAKNHYPKGLRTL